MAPRVKKQAQKEAEETKPKGKAPERSLLTMELARAAAAGEDAGSSIENIQTHLQNRLLSLKKSAEAGMTDEMETVISNGVAGVVAKAKDHHVYVNNELKISMDLQDQVKSEHERALEDVSRMAAEAGQPMERDSELNDNVKRAKQAAQDEMKILQRKYM